MPSMYILSNVILELALSADGLPHLNLKIYVLRLNFDYSHIMALVLI